MKKINFSKICSSVIAILLAITILAPYLEPFTVYADPPGQMVTVKSSPKPQPYRMSIENQKKVDAALIKWAEEKEKEEAEAPTKEKLENMEKALNVANDSIPDIIEFIKGAAEGGDFDTSGFVTMVADLASGILACIVPWGTVASVGLSLVKNVLIALMGGEDGPSEVALMEDRLNQRLDEIADQISQVQDKLNDLSDQINESTELIINSVSTAIENESDKNHLRDFMLSSGVGDFSYNQLRNYIYGTTSDNRNGMNAYYALLQEAQLHGGTSEEIKRYYDLLYRGLIESRESFHDYITGDGFGKSIVATYYDILLVRPDLTEELGMSAEEATIQFAYDLYQTELMMDQLILACNNYQYMQMAINGTTEYNYGGSKTVTAKEILNDDKESVIAKSLYVGIDEMRMQFAEDLMYVLCVTNTYVVEENGEYYYHMLSEVDDTEYAPVLEGQTIYLNDIPAVVVERFDLDVQAFKYVGEGVVNEDGIVEISSTNKNSSITLIYTDDNNMPITMSTIQFRDARNDGFSGGMGTEEMPYLISTADQFLNIADDMTLYYRLVNDIDFDGADINPIGFSLNNVDSEVYEEFTGVLDGDGFTVSNLNVAGSVHSGIFAKIGDEGVVKNLTVSNVSVNVSISEVGKSSATFTGGVIAGTNNGTIESCVVTGCEMVTVSETTNEDAERSVYFKYGGIAGINNGTITAAWVKNSKVDVSSTHEFGGASTSTNKNEVYVGGICGTNPGMLEYVGVDKDVKVNAYTKSILNPKSTVNPYLKAIAAGITTHDGIQTETEHGVKSITNLANIYSATADGNVTAKRELQVKSGWGKHYKNAKAQKDYLVTDFNDDLLDKVTADAKDIDEAFAEDPVYEVVITDETEKYPVGSVELNQDKLEISVNGEKLEDFYILSLYGFNTYNKDYDNERSMNVTVMFSAEIDGREFMLTGVLPVTVDKNRVTSIELINYKDTYFKGESPKTEAMVNVIDANGSKGTESNVQITLVNADEVLSQIGTNQLVISYKGLEYSMEIEVLCDVHYEYLDYENPERYTFVQHVNATCQHGGYDEYRCLGCNETLKTNRTDSVNHNRVRDISKKATCATPGVIGKVYCSYCNEVFEEEVELPRLAHNIVNKGDAENHYCTQCDTYYAHEYVVSESLVDGKVTYTYTCYTCGYVGEKQDSNIITNEERLRPTVIVSDGFATAAGDLVTVYVDLENNPGVNGANFGIRYDERLELVEWYEGEFFANTSAAASHAVSCGYNFIWGTEETRTAAGGNLLKLVFRLPNDATVNDTYDVAVVYSVVAESVGGFSLPDSVAATYNFDINLPQKFKTKDGVIRVVNRLPGDIDNNKTVNLVDALYLSNCLVNSTQYPITLEVKQYGDVNLDRLVTVNDVVKILQSLSGGYGASLLAPEYRVQLNTNGYNYNPDALFVQLYGANNTYAALVEIEEAMKQREGYKFLGWYTRLEGGVKIEADNYKTQFVAYDQNQKIQTLYAHWEKNVVNFEMNGATSEWIEKESYTGGEKVIVLPEPIEQYSILFKDATGAVASQRGTLSHEFAYWEGSDGAKYYAGDEFPVHKLNMGEYTLTAKWGEWVFDIPVMEKVGYDSTKIAFYKTKDAPDNEAIASDNYEAIKALPVDKDELVRVLYVRWTAPITYIIHYNANGGTGEMPDTVHTYDVKKQLSTNIFKKQYDVIFNYGACGAPDGKDKVEHKFAGWSKDGVTVLSSDWVENWTAEDNKEFTVYAIWNDAEVELPAEPTTPYIGYKFDGWYKDAAFTKYAGKAGDKIKTTEACTLYAKWTPMEYTVQYSHNTMGTSNAPAGNSDQCYTDPIMSDISSNDKVTYGVTGTYLDVPMTNHYSFVGWFTQPVGGTQITDGTGKVINATAITSNGTQLYAHWKQSYTGIYVYDETSLRAIADIPSATYHIVKDISLTKSWTPINSFSGSIDGHGHTISNLKFVYESTASNMGEAVSNYGFVRELKGTIKNLNFNQLTMNIIKYKDGMPDSNVGGIVGYLDGGKLSNVHLYDSKISIDHYREVSSGGNYVNTYVGGFVGRMVSGTVENCSIGGNSEVWGKAGRATGDADAHCFAGGIVGYQTGGAVTGCSRADSVAVSSRTRVSSSTSASRSSAGGITGKTSSSGIIASCTSTASNVSGAWDNDGNYATENSYKLTGKISGSYSNAVSRGNGKNARWRITDEGDYWTRFAEDWSINIKKADLKAMGYTSVKINITFWVDEIDQGNQRVHIATADGTKIDQFSFESTPSSWHQYSRDITIPIDKFGTNMDFKTIWEGYGNGEDDWDLGETTITYDFK